MNISFVVDLSLSLCGFMKIIHKGRCVKKITKNIEKCKNYTRWLVDGL